MHRYTPSQTIGPFFAPALAGAASNRYRPLLTEHAQFREPAGPPIQIVGRVLDGEGKPITDALIETAQVNGIGVVEDGAGIARSGTQTGEYRIYTVKPGPQAPTSAPCVEMILLMRGLLNHLFTRVYFSDEQALNDDDAFLGSIPHETRSRFLAHREEAGLYRFDIHMQGASETPFIDR